MYIFEIIDGFSKFIKLFAVKTTKTSEVIDCLESSFQSYSRPIIMVSDLESSFTSNEFSSFVNDHNIQHIKIATTARQAKGQSERFNRGFTKLSDLYTTNIKN